MEILPGVFGLAVTGLAAQAEEPMADLLEIAHTAGGLDVRFAYLALAISEIRGLWGQVIPYQQAATPHLSPTFDRCLSD